MAIQRDANGMVGLDAEQVIRTMATILPDGGLAQQVVQVGGNLVPDEYDNIALTYVAAGPGAGEIQTVTYTLNGNPVAVLTMSYDGSDRLTNVSRS